MCIMHHTGTIHQITATRQRNPNGSTSSYIISIWNLISSLDLLILNQTRKSNPGYCVQGITRYNLVTRYMIGSTCSVTTFAGEWNLDDLVGINFVTVVGVAWKVVSSKEV
uniref:Uncharacterized protein n=1 Tax=Medicago truncatula TaxID=3880 RepID=I3SSN3_MEDTR|nr:unknown [Medicago truncatula]